MVFVAELNCSSSESISYGLIPDRSTEEQQRWLNLVTLKEVGESECQMVFKLPQ